MFLLLEVLLFGLLTTLLYTWFIRKYNYWKLRGVPYEYPAFLFGNMLPLAIGDMPVGKYFEKIYNKFEGPYFGIFAFSRPYLVIKDHEIIKRILIKDFHLFQNRHFLYDEESDPIMSNSLFAIKTPTWKLLRAKLSPIFSSGKMKTMFYMMKECGEDLESYIQTILNKDVEARELASKYTTEVVASCAFGIRTDSFTNENSEFRKAGIKILERKFFTNIKALAYTFAPAFAKLCKFRFIPRASANFFTKVFMDTIGQREETKLRRNDVIDILIDLKNKETKDDEFKFHGDRLVAQAVIFLAAGLEITSATISFALHEICIHPEIQDRLRKEILEVIDHHGSLVYEAVQDMKYLQMVVSETLRKYPLTSFLIRECSEDYKIAKTGLVLEKGMPVIIPQHGLHWDPQYFPNPEVFDPERFSDKNKNKIASCVYLPFGDGPRACIGERFALMSTKLGIIHVLRKYVLEINTRTEEPLTYSRSTHLQPRNGIHLTLRQV